MKRGPKGVIEFLSFDTQFCDCIPEFKKFRATKWRYALQFLNDTGMAFYFLRRLKDTRTEGSIPTWVISQLECDFGANQRRVEVMSRRFDLINRKFNDAGVRYAVLKGVSLVPEFCPSAPLRHQGDFDYLVDERSLPVAYRALEEAGYRTKPRFSNQEFIFLPLASGSAPRGSEQYSSQAPHAVELHLDIWDAVQHRLPPLPNLFSVERITTHQWNGLEFPVLTDEDAFLVQVLHACQHLFTYWIRISCLLEIGFFFERRAADTALWNRVAQRVGDNLMLREFVVVISELVAQIFVAPLPSLVRVWGNGVRPATRVWIEHYAQDCAFCEVPAYDFRLFPKAKLILFLHRQYRDDMPAGKVLVRNRLIPSSRLGRIVSSVRNNPSLILNRLWWKRQLLLRRAMFHALSGLRYLCEIPRWLWLNRHRAHSTAT